MNDTEPQVGAASAHLATLLERINGVVIGQTTVVEQVVCALLANGHVLLEGVPGLGKTLLVRALAACFAGSFKRIQFTPDLMPADITGHVYYDAPENRFRMRHGPVFTNLLLADEINRAPAKSQAALLEVMQEHQVTLDGERHALTAPFMVLATQNPIESEGTYPLPEAELDRFLLKVNIDYPAFADEVALTREITTGRSEDMQALAPELAFISAADVVALQRLCAGVTVDAQVLDYAVRLVRATRSHQAILRGAGTRACIALVRAAKARALVRGTDFVLPDDIKAMAPPVLRHRIALAPELEIDGVGVDHALAAVLDDVEAPRA